MNKNSSYDVEMDDGSTVDPVCVNRNNPIVTHVLYPLFIVTLVTEFINSAKEGLFSKRILRSILS